MSKFQRLLVEAMGSMNAEKFAKLCKVTPMYMCRLIENEGIIPCDSILNNIAERSEGRVCFEQLKSSLKDVNPDNIESEIMRLIKMHDEIKKEVIIDNINRLVKENLKSACAGKTKWLMEVTGCTRYTVEAFMSKAEIKRSNKISLYSMCKIANTLGVSVWEFFEVNGKVEDAMKEIPSRKSPEYLTFQRNIARKAWEESPESKHTKWKELHWVKRQDFTDKLFLEYKNQERVN